MGQRWGVRRYQNKDGSYTNAGRHRYGLGDGESYDGVNKSSGGSGSGSSSSSNSSNSTPQKKKGLTKKQKIALGVAAGVAGAAALGTAAYVHNARNRGVENAKKAMWDEAPDYYWKYRSPTRDDWVKVQDMSTDELIKYHNAQNKENKEMLNRVDRYARNSTFDRKKAGKMQMQMDRNARRMARKYGKDSMDAIQARNDWGDYNWANAVKNRKWSKVKKDLLSYRPAEWT